MRQGEAEPKTQSLLSSAMLVTGLTAANLVLNFAIQLVVADLFGASRLTDAYFLGTSIPGLVSTVLAGSLSVVLIPSFLEVLHRDGEVDAWRVGTTFFFCVASVLLGLVLVFEVFAVPIVRLLAPGFDAASLAETTRVFRIAAPASGFLGAFSILTGFYYALRRFAQPGIMLAVGSAVNLVLALVLAPALGVTGLAIALTVGAAVEFFLVARVLVADGRGWLLTRLSDPRLHALGRLAVPVILGATVYKSDYLIGRVIASLLPAGQLSYLAYANRIVTTLLAIGAGGLTTVFFPRFATATARDDRPALTDDVERSLRYLVFVMVPIVLIFGLLAENLIGLAFQRGAFDAAATQGTAYAALSYLGYVYVGALSGVPANALYSLKRMAHVVALGIGGLVLYVVLAVLLVPHIGFVGVGASASISAILVFGAYVVVLRANAVHVRFVALARYHLSVLPGALSASLVVIACKWAFAPNWTVVLTAALLGPAAYVVAGRVVRNAEAGLIVERLRVLARRLVKPMRTV